MNNIFASLPEDMRNEVFDVIVQGDSVRIERIVSRGHITPPSQWYDQPQNEWVMVLKGEAKILMEHQPEIYLAQGSYLTIPAHTRHRVQWTQPDTETVWLAVHY